MIARPPYAPLFEWDGWRLNINSERPENFSLSLDRQPLHNNAYIFSIQVAFISAVIALMIGYPMGVFPSARRPGAAPHLSPDDG